MRHSLGLVSVLFGFLGFVLLEVSFHVYRVEVHEALGAYLLRDPIYASVMDSASFEFRSSLPYWVHYKVLLSSWLTDCLCFPLGLGVGFAISAWLIGRSRLCCRHFWEGSLLSL